MTPKRFAMALALLAGLIGSGTSARAQQVISKEVAQEGSYCHMKFPAMRENTLSGPAPDLTTTGDLIDFYGPCDHDPLGKEEIESQRLEWQHRYDSDYGN